MEGAAHYSFNLYLLYAFFQYCERAEKIKPGLLLIVQFAAQCLQLTRLAAVLFRDVTEHFRHKLPVLISSDNAKMHVQQFLVRFYPSDIRVASQQTIFIKQVRRLGNKTRPSITGGYLDNLPRISSGMSQLADLR